METRIPRCVLTHIDPYPSLLQLKKLLDGHTYTSPASSQETMHNTEIGANQEPPHLQGYLTHKKGTHPSYDHHWTLCIVLL